MRMPILSYVPYSLAASALLGGVIAACQAPLDIRPAKSQHSDHATAAIPHGDIPGVSPLLTRDCVKNPKQRRGLTHNDEPKNGLTVEALRANEGLINFLASNSLAALSELTSADAAPERKAALRSLAKSDGMDLTKYVVMCALNPCQEVTVHEAKDDQFRVQAMTFSGELGLCAGNEKYGNWYSGTPTPACLQAVSACVLARVNAHNKKVVISIRDPYSIIELEDKVPVETEYREGGGTPIPSFAPCPSDGQNCGYSPQYVGRCDSGSKVTLTGFGQGVKVRVCQGLYGCEAEFTDRWYASPLNCAPNSTSCTSSGISSEISFDCPVQVVNQPGYYSVMTKAPPSNPQSPVSIKAKCTSENPTIPPTSCEYPARERDVFTLQEGAFYGSIFDAPANVPPASPYKCPPPVARDILAGHQFACYSDVWNFDAAELSDRFCALPSPPYPTCLLNTPQPCSDKSLDCDILNQQGLPSLIRSCHGTTADSASQVYQAMTVYLNHPCDLFEDLASCSCANPKKSSTLWHPNFTWTSP